MANTVFDCLPFAATIDDVIFCVHGGIPRPLSPNETALESINSIPCPTAVRVNAVDERAKQIKQLSNDLLWSDPAQREQEKRLDQTGFGEGERGPGAICYGERAIQNFLDANGMSHIVRAHEPTQKGINISKGGRVITIFSTSRVSVNDEYEYECRIMVAKMLFVGAFWWIRRILLQLIILMHRELTLVRCMKVISCLVDEESDSDDSISMEVVEDEEY